MNSKEVIKYRKMTDLLKVLGNPARLMIIEKLLSGEKCVGKIEDIVGLKQANVSQHLNTLRACGIVDYRSQGKKRCYYLKAPGSIKELIQCIRKGA